MSWLAIAWAETAPVADVYERAILTLMAHRASPDGTGAYPSVPTIARFACCDDKTIERRMVALRKRRVIAPGDQKLAARIDRRYRPKVYDLLIPHEFYSATQLEEVDRNRAERGLAPLTPEDRPPLANPGRGRKTREDKGKPRPPKQQADEAGSGSSEPEPEEQGGLSVPPDEVPEDGESGGTTSPRQGGLQVPPRGDYKTPKTVPAGTGPVEQSVPGGETPPPDPASRTTADQSESVVSTELEYVGKYLGEIGQNDTAQVDDEEPLSNWSTWGLAALQAELAKRMDREVLFSSPLNARAIREITTAIQVKGGEPELAHTGVGPALAQAAREATTASRGGTATAVRRRHRR